MSFNLIPLTEWIEAGKSLSAPWNSSHKFKHLDGINAYHSVRFGKAAKIAQCRKDLFCSICLVNREVFDSDTALKLLADEIRTILTNKRNIQRGNYE